jgi:hypothetical protein
MNRDPYPALCGFEDADEEELIAPAIGDVTLAS